MSDTISTKGCEFKYIGNGIYKAEIPAKGEDKMSNWVKFSGSPFFANYHENGIIFKYKDGSESHIMYSIEGVSLSQVTHYLICKPHPHREMIKRWADTGQPVYCNNRLLNNPVWHYDNNYSFNKPKKTIKFRNYLREDGSVKVCMCDSNPVYFKEWLGDWQEVEVDD